MGRGADGTLTFDAAVAAGEQQFRLQGERAFCYALDIGTAHYFYEVRPYTQAGQADERHLVTTADKQGARKYFDPLPYLLDRSTQEKALREAVLFKRAIKPQRPLVCIVHGDEFECHEHFVKRLTDKSLPEILKFWHPEEVEQTPVLQRRVKLSLTKVNSETWEEVFWGDLSEGFTGNRSSPREAVVNMISGQRLAVLLDVTLRSENLSRVTLDHLDHFFEFWDRWPNLPEKLLLLVCLNFKYERRFEGGRKLYFWRPPELNAIPELARRQTAGAVRHPARRRRRRRQRRPRERVLQPDGRGCRQRLQFEFVHARWVHPDDAPARPLLQKTHMRMRR
jgi:hypothetical protein